MLTVDYMVKKRRKENMRKCTRKEKIAGEWAARKFNQEAWNMYVETDPLDIYEYINEIFNKGIIHILFHFFSYRLHF